MKSARFECCTGVTADSTRAPLVNTDKSHSLRARPTALLNGARDRDISLRSRSASRGAQTARRMQPDDHPDGQPFSANMGDPVPGTYSFTPTQLLELRSELEEEFARLLCSADAEQTGDSLSANEAAEPDCQSSILRQAIVKAQSQARLMAVAAALRRLDNGEYGVCVRCGNRIPFDRLSVIPETTLCVACGGTGQKHDDRYAFPEDGVVAATAIAATRSGMRQDTSTSPGRAPLSSSAQKREEALT